MQRADSRKTDKRWNRCTENTTADWLETEPADRHILWAIFQSQWEACSWRLTDLRAFTQSPNTRIAVLCRTLFLRLKIYLTSKRQYWVTELLLMWCIRKKQSLTCNRKFQSQDLSENMGDMWPGYHLFIAVHISNLGQKNDHTKMVTSVDEIKVANRFLKVNLKTNIGS